MKDLFNTVEPSVGAAADYYIIKQTIDDKKITLITSDPHDSVLIQLLINYCLFDVVS